MPLCLSKMASAEKYDYELQLQLTEVKVTGHLDWTYFITQYGSNFVLCAIPSAEKLVLLPC